MKSDNVIINRDFNTIEHKYGGEVITNNFVDDIALANLEFRGLTISTNNKAELAFTRIANGYGDLYRVF